MKNQKGVSLASLAISTALVTTLSVTAVQCVDDSDEVLAKADEAKAQYAHSEVSEQLALNNQAYYIEKFTGEYNGNLMEYLEEKDFVNKDGVVNMSSLLGKRENKFPFGKGSDSSDVYKVESTADNDAKIIYYDEDGMQTEVGELYSNT